MAKKKVKSKPKQPPKSSIPENLTTKVLAESYSSPSPPVFMKVCRLCESKDGPFLNIFDADKVTAKKIEELMPFGIAENDDLPHKICFRCSAKLEELYEFIQKCIKTQENLRTELGKTGPFITKAKTVKAWEEKLNKNNMSNDDICDALIKKAMAGIKNIPVSPPAEEVPIKRVTRRSETTVVKTETVSDNEDGNISLKDVKSQMLKNKDKVPASKPAKAVSNNVESAAKPSSVKNPQKEENQPANKPKNNALINNFSFDYVGEKPPSESVEKTPKKPAEKPFNIMDYISMIKVNGVGVLFQCKLCNRNFLKKEVVESHHCAKNGVPKVEIPKTVPVQEAPKVSTVKYITLDNTMKKSQPWKYNENSNGSSTDSEKSSREENKQQEQRVQSAPVVKPKPKAGPASKTRRVENDNAHPGPSHSSDSQPPPTNVQTPSVHIPSTPNLNGRFKLVPGPNNMFTLVEDTSVPVVENHKSKKRKSETESEIKTKEPKRGNHKSNSPDVINLEEKSTPYPVGLFQTVAHSGQMYQQPMATPTVAFTTPAMKKQSYTVVQTGNPSKLLISTKALAPPVEVPKKRVRKSKPEVQEDDDSKEPFKVTLEDVAPPKDAGFFTFINVDPLLQPSYVLPTDNIIQESQISTSSAVQNAPENKESKDKDKYSCNMCGESFTREKKLLAHIQSHYSKMDEEDQLRAEKGPKKKSRKS
ncbi:uncharacterized protein LOC111348891 [Spodoptera litura]|uniref:Uncharacterized protein LOC111348891 n=1 Tax=Spodoptera litura TaxID=69820 RepID=A0A9J7DNP8_SPOLT|nr:uncharacterized protein LOC111348891 [Spodoptera litura]